MAQIPLWVIGRVVSTIFITPLTVGNDGTLTEGTGGNLIGRCESVSYSGRNQLENISPMDARGANYVITESESTFTFSEILQNTGQPTIDNVLSLAAMQFDYVKCQVARNGKLFTMYGVIEDYSENLVKGKCMGNLTVKQILLTSGINGQDEPTYSANPGFTNG